MKLLKAQWMVAGAALLASNMALAELYGGVGYSAAELEGGSEEYDLGAIYGRVGTQFNENLSAEFRVGLGVTDDDDVEIDKYFGGYVRGGLPLEGITPYIIAGITDVDIESGSGSDSDNDISYGVGVDFQIDNQLMLNVEYMTMYDDEIDNADVEITALSLGVAAKF